MEGRRLSRPSTTTTTTTIKCSNLAGGVNEVYSLLVDSNQQLLRKRWLCRLLKQQQLLPVVLLQLKIHLRLLVLLLTTAITTTTTTTATGTSQEKMAWSFAETTTTIGTITTTTPTTTTTITSQKKTGPLFGRTTTTITTTITTTTITTIKLLLQLRKTTVQSIAATTTTPWGIKTHQFCNHNFYNTWGNFDKKLYSVSSIVTAKYDNFSQLHPNNVATLPCKS